MKEVAWFDLWCLTPLSTLFQLHHGGHVVSSAPCLSGEDFTTLVVICTDCIDFKSFIDVTF
jgi:hypothetical protein